MIPAISYIAVVRQFALAYDIPFFTYPQMLKAIKAYEFIASRQN